MVFSVVISEEHEIAIECLYIVQFSKILYQGVLCVIDVFFYLVKV